MNTQSMEALRHWLVLKLVPQFGIKTLQKVTQIHSIQSFLELPPDKLRQLKFNAKQIKAITAPDQPVIDRIEQWASQANHHLICYDDPLYPETLRNIANAPLLLFAIGDPTLLSTPQLAIIGSRDLTITGQENAFNFAKQMVQLDITVTSGLAIGVDGYSHRGALAGDGKTIAVLGTGLAQIYPKRHRSLAQEIAQSGTLLSEFLPDQTARPENFPRRNRIIAGLCQGTLVVEAAIKSGSLITAKYAMEQNREVFAIPGSIHNPMSKGCHWLIKQGAKLVEHSLDIVEEVTEFQHHIAKLTSNLSAPSQTLKVRSTNSNITGLLQHIGFEITTVDKIAERSLLPINDILAQLLDMELSGEIAAVGGGYMRI